MAPRKSRRRGPKSLPARAKKIRGAGQKCAPSCVFSSRNRTDKDRLVMLSTRMLQRKNRGFGNQTMQSYRNGFNCMWRFASKVMKRFGIPRPGQFRSTNAHGGRMWATKQECRLTGKQAATIIEACMDNQATQSQLAKVRHSLSYAYLLTHSVPRSNYKEVAAMVDSFIQSEIAPPTKSLIPTRIPTPEQLKSAHTKPWTAECGQSLIACVSNPQRGQY